MPYFMRKELILITIVLLSSMFILSSCNEGITPGGSSKMSSIYGAGLYNSNNKGFMVVDVNDSFDLHIEGHYFKKNVSDELPEISLFLNYSENLRLLNENGVNNFKFNEKCINNNYYEFNSKEDIKFIAPKTGNFRICSEIILNGSDIFYNKDPVNKATPCVYICAIEKHQDYEDYCFKNNIEPYKNREQISERWIDFQTKFDFNKLLKKIANAKFFVKSNYS